MNLKIKLEVIIIKDKDVRESLLWLMQTKIFINNMIQHFYLL
jgi:hypothetical protein